MPRRPTDQIVPINPTSLLPALRGEGFTQPTYTQVPNDLFPMMRDLSEAELKVLLAIIRETLGYHRTTVQLSISNLECATGLVRHTVISTCQRLRQAGLITRVRLYPTSHWRLNIQEDTHIKLNQGERTQKPDPNQPQLV